MNAPHQSQPWGRRLLLVVVVLAGLVGVAALVRLEGIESAIGAGRDALADAPPGFIGALLVLGPLLGFFLPRLSVCFLGGALLGFGPGLAWSQASTVLGSYMLFLVVRWGAREWAAQKIEGHPRLESLARAPAGFWTVVVLRQLPLPNPAINVALGLGATRHWVFVIGSLLAFLPEGVLATWAGAGLRSSSLMLAIPKVFAVLALLWVCGWAMRRFMGRRTEAGEPGVHPVGAPSEPRSA